MKARLARLVADWIESTPEELTHLSVITVGEIRKIDLLDEDAARFNSKAISGVPARFRLDSFSQPKKRNALSKE